MSRRKNTIAEDAADTLIQVHKRNENEDEQPNKKLTIKEKVRKIGHAVYNSEYREFLSRGKSLD